MAVGEADRHYPKPDFKNTLRGHPYLTKKAPGKFPAQVIYFHRFLRNLSFSTVWKLPPPSCWL